MIVIKKILHFSSLAFNFQIKLQFRIHKYEKLFTTWQAINKISSICCLGRFEWKLICQHLRNRKTRKTLNQFNTVYSVFSQLSLKKKQRGWSISRVPSYLHHYSRSTNRPSWRWCVHALWRAFTDSALIIDSRKTIFSLKYIIYTYIFNKA